MSERFDMKLESKLFRPKCLASGNCQKTNTIIENTLKDYKFIIISVMQNIADRYSRNPGYKWINTKFNSITGVDFDDDPVKGLNTVYAWIQGRGLEAAVVHIKWLRSHTAHVELVKEIETIAYNVLYHLRKIRQINNGRLFFSLTPKGLPYDPGKQELINLEKDAPYNFSDLFCSKGMYAAAVYFNDTDLIKESRTYCLDVIHAITNRHFVNDQQQYNGRNPSPTISDRYSHAPYSLALSIIILLLEHEKDKSIAQQGLDILKYVISNHVNISSRWSNLENYALVEFIDGFGKPYVENEKILVDPGHAIEFAGYGIKLCSILNQLCFSEEHTLKQLEISLFEIIHVHFKKGFNTRFGGIYKSVDLITGDPINSEMPWWSLPETMKAALSTFDVVSSPCQQQLLLDIYVQCSNSFLRNYVRTKPHLLIAQTRNELGKLIDAIPATPDNDPGYHTGMSLIDCYTILEKKLIPPVSYVKGAPNPENIKPKTRS